MMKKGVRMSGSPMTDLGATGERTGGGNADTARRIRSVGIAAAIAWALAAPGCASVLGIEDLTTQDGGASGGTSSGLGGGDGGPLGGGTRGTTGASTTAGT